jgi:hypothetical protein
MAGSTLYNDQNLSELKISKRPREPGRPRPRFPFRNPNSALRVRSAPPGPKLQSPGPRPQVSDLRYSLFTTRTVAAIARWSEPGPSMTS